MTHNYVRHNTQTQAQRRTFAHERNYIYWSWIRDCRWSGEASVPFSSISSAKVSYLSPRRTQWKSRYVRCLYLRVLLIGGIFSTRTISLSIMAASAVFEQLRSAYQLNFNQTRQEFIHSIFQRNIPTQDLHDIRVTLFKATQTVG